MQHGLLTRRELLDRCASLGFLTVSVSFALPDAVTAWAEQDHVREATAWDEVGPFYKRNAPHTAHLRGPGDSGLPLSVSGQVFDTRGRALDHATLEIWHADHLGHYDIDGYRYRTTLRAERSGKYSFDSVIPGHYPDRVCQHVHYRVSAPGCKTLVTQMYFATDPVFEGDPDRNYKKDPVIQSRDLVRPVTIGGNPKTMVASVTFEIVLEPV
jgi:hydroxyquinol 1,2-dioxygenase